MKSPTNKERLGYDGISRPTPELVIGLVGAVGAGVSLTANVLAEILSQQYGYECRTIKASEIIRQNSEKTSLKKPAINGADRIVDLQKVGTELRDRFGDEYIAAKIVEQIAAHRHIEGGYSNETTVPQPKPRRLVTIIDSLKHHAETQLLRSVYGGVYWQFTVFAPEEVREDRLKRFGVDRSSISSIFSRDEDDPDDHGQKVSKTAYLSDFFIRNDGENDVQLRAACERFLELVFNISVHTPNAHEAGMYAAVSAASKSACLSRQVGAAIYSSSGELISVGWNDVPKFGGSLYREDDGDHDHRCFKWGGRVCHNDRKKEALYSTVFDKLNSSGLLKEGASELDLRSALKKTPIKDLIEYSRAVHAEMEAILGAARSGKSALSGASLYTTTFPCHNCARHIVAAGISRVFYIEPYAKSLATELHSDAISMRERPGKVAFLQYEGVGPESLLKLFHNGSSRKTDGSATVADKKTALPTLPPPLDGFTTHEKRVIERLSSSEGAD